MLVELEEITCANCKIVFWITQGHDERLRDSHNSFYCPRGHSQWYPQKTNEDKLRAQVRNKEALLQEAMEKIKALENHPKKPRKKRTIKKK